MIPRLIRRRRCRLAILEVIRTPASKVVLGKPRVEESTLAVHQMPDSQAIPQLLRALDFPEGRIAEPELAELAGVLATDYRTVPALPSPEMTRRLAGFAKTSIDPRRDAWRKWRNSENFRVRLPDFDSDEIAVHAAPYTRGAGLLLWGFSCDTRSGDRGAFVIFLNTAHQPGAVTATVAHELGHYIHKSITGDECAPLSPLAANFASHLDDEGELFSDSLVALSAYSTEAVAKARYSRSGTIGWIEEILNARDYIRPEYRIDFSGKLVSPVWRIRYLAAVIHFFKLRKALLETAGI